MRHTEPSSAAGAIQTPGATQAAGASGRKGRAAGATARPGGREARLEFRLTGALRERIEKAALAQGQSLSEFAASTLAREAEEVLQRHHERALSERDWEHFCQALLHPPAPTPALQTAASTYREAVRVEGDSTVVDGEAWKESLAAADPKLLHDPH